VAESLAEAGCDTTVVLGARPMDKYVPLPPDQKLREAIGLKTGDKVLSVVARLTPWKGHQTLLDAFRRVLDDEPDARLLVIGDAGFWTDDYTADLHRQAEDLGCAEAVYWLGFREDIPQLLALTDVMVLPSKDEPFGIVLVEAMAAGKPVIATRTGGPLDIVTEGVTGLLVEAGDAGQLADAILQLLGDPERAAAMGRAGRKRAEEHFDISRVLTQLYDVYDKMLKHQ
jgi:glycosyltransferase involved in cell wall biosynthesis